MIFLTVACERSISVVNRGLSLTRPRIDLPPALLSAPVGKSGRIARDLAGP